MPTNVIMPALELAQESGKVLHWLKSPGDTVTKGEPLVAIETDKGTTAIEAPASGGLGGATARAGDAGPAGPAGPGGQAVPPTFAPPGAPSAGPAAAVAPPPRAGGVPPVPAPA